LFVFERGKISWKTAGAAYLTTAEIERLMAAARKAATQSADPVLGAPH